MVLIVDDDNAVRMSIGLALTHAGLDNCAVSNETDALEAVRRPATSLVILDMNLTLSSTGQQGIEMLRKIKILRPEVPVIIITAWGTIPLAVEAMNYGAADFLTKPWSNRDLVAKVRRALAGSGNAGEPSIETLDDVERNAIIEALRLCDGNLSTTARRLGITRQALYRRMEKYGL